MLLTLLIGLLVLATLAFIIWRGWFFLRNPTRHIPPGTDFLSPADGYVVYVKRVEQGQIPFAIKNEQAIPLEEFSVCAALQGTSGYLVGIYMTAFSVHHNRTPLAGQVTALARTENRRNQTMAPMMTHLMTGRQPFETHCRYLVENQRVTTLIDTGNGIYALIQIADKWISMIVNELVPEQRLQRGERFGMIRFGSQVDVFLSDELGYLPEVQTGAYVYAGLSTIAVKKQG